LWVSSAPGLESGAADRRDLGVTVYNDDLALVREVRTIELPAGPSELRFTDVPSAIRPETVSVEAPDGKLEVREQNYEFDLLSHEKVLEKYVGRELTVYVRNEHSGEEHPVAAKLLGTNGGLVFEVGNEIALGLPGRVVVPKLPQDLIARPTLVWSLESAESGARAVEASYLTRGIGWHADYVARLSKDESTLDLTGWVTIRNHSGASFEHAKLKLVAGSVHQIRPPEPAQMEVMARAVPLMASDTARGFSERELFEYHLYELGTPTTLKDNQQKQIELLAAARVPVTKKYRIESTAYSEPRPYAEGTGAAPVRNAAVTLEFLNRKDHALGRALPKGIVRVYKRDADDAFVFAGEDEIDHVPEGETVELEIGDAFDVVWEKAVLESRRIADDRIDADVEFTVRNRKKESVTVTVSERFFGDYDLISSSVAARKPDAFTIEFELAVPAGREAKVRYRVQVRQ
jgi:hypothetical protein